jgi:hypothetical protein
MTGPRDTPTRFAVPVNYETGKELSTRQVLHLAKLTECGEMLYAAMHEAEGSSLPGEHQEHVFMSRRMNIAATQIETALMFARKAAREAK